MSDSSTPPLLPTLDKRLRRLLEQWERARTMGRPVTAQDLCPDDEELAAKLQAHISEAIETGDSLRERSDNSEPRLEWIERYKVIRHIGEGGSSNVYLCEAPNLNRRVALKLLKVSQCDDRRQRRFQFEIDLLATLEHPGVARIFDAGVADVGRGPQPFYTMEYVQGQRLDQFLANTTKDGFPIADRIEMFLRIATAVGHAHENGIVHRDLKPSNLLVTEAGEVKVIDFGLARLSDSERTVAMVTKTGHMVGTPLYMSPEQFSEDHRLTDARSDIYGLGLVLYQMLAERLPYDLVGKPLIEIANTVIRDPPIPLRRFDSRFRGDLEVIVGKTLQKEPGHRYQSIAALTDDLRRYLDGRPILAQRPRAIDPIIHWSRRNPLLVAVTGVAAMLLITTSILAMASTVIANQQTKQLKQQSDLAEQKSIHLEDANEELRASLGRLRKSTANATLMRIALSVESNPPLARSLLFDTSLIAEDQRGFAWKLLERQSDWELVRGRWNRGPVLASSFSGNGERLAAVARGAIDIRRTSDLSMVWSIKDRIEAPTMVALDSTGERVAYRKPDFSIWLFDHELGEKRQLATADMRATSMSWSPSDNLVIGFSDGMVRLYDRKRDSTPREFQVADAPIIGLRVSNDGSMLGTVGRDGIVQRVDLADGAMIDSYSLGVKQILMASLGPDGRYVGGGKRFNYLSVWDRHTDRRIAADSNPGPFVNAAILNQPEPQIAIATRGRIKLLRPEKRSVFLHLSRFEVRTLTSSDDSSLLLAGDEDGTIILFQTQGRTARRAVAMAASRATVVRFLDSGKTIAVSGGSHPTAVHDATSGEHRAFLPPTTTPIVDAECNADGTMLYYSSADGEIGSWDTKRSQPGPLQTRAEQRLFDISLANDEKTLVGLSKSGDLYLYDLETGDHQTRPVTHQQKCSALAISNVKSRLFSADDDGIIKSWDQQTGQQIASTLDRKSRIRELTLHPEENLLAAACSDGYVRIYDSESLSLVQELIVHTSAVRSLDFSADGKTLATGGLDSRLILWDTRLWQPQIAWDVDGNGIHSVRFSPDGTQLVVVGNHNQLLVWETE